MPRSESIIIDPYEGDALTIIVNGVCITTVAEPGGRRRNYAHVPPLRFARWLAANWRRIRWEPPNPEPDLDWQLAHNTATIGSGYIWPNITFTSDGADRIRVIAKAGKANWNEPVRYLTDYDGAIPAPEFERAVADFIADCARADPELTEHWRTVTDEARDPATLARARLEARLGYDHGAAPAELFNAGPGDPQPA